MQAIQNGLKPNKILTDPEQWFVRLFGPKNDNRHNREKRTRSTNLEAEINGPLGN